MTTSILRYHQSFRPTIPVFPEIIESGGELGQKGDIEKIEKWLKIFSKILNPMYQFISSQFKTFTSSFPQNNEEEGELRQKGDIKKIRND